MVQDYTVGLPEDGSVLCRFWGDECVAYHDLIGATHLIADAGAVLFKAVSTHPMNRAQLLAELSAAFEFPDDFVVADFFDTLVSNYQHLGLLAVTQHP